MSKNILLLFVILTGTAYQYDIMLSCDYISWYLLMGGTGLLIVKIALFLYFSF